MTHPRGRLWFWWPLVALCCWWTISVAHAADGPRFSLQVNAPEPFAALLLKHLNIQRFQHLSDLDATELRRLADQLPRDVRDLMGTQGHFAPQVSVELRAPSAGSAPPLGTVTLAVEPGPTARVGEVLLSVRGPAQLDLTGPLKAQWGLPSGQPFSQSAWDDAKAAALRQLTQHQYPAATLVGSLADVDSTTHTVNLALEIDPGPAFTFGAVQTEGLERYEADWVRHLVELSGVVPGSPYELSRLQSAQQRLAQSGYFDSVFVYVDPQGPHDHSPVHVKVREALRQKWVLGLGGSTDSGPRLSAEHRWRRVPWLDWRAHTQLKMERDARSAETELASPVDAEGWHWLAGIKASRLVDGPDTVTGQQYRLGRAKNEENLDRTHYLQWDRSRVRDATPGAPAPDATQAISANLGWVRRQFDSLPFPKRGYSLSAEVGVGVTVSQRSAPYVRAKGRWHGLWPLPTERSGRLAARLEGGVVVAKASTPVPESQLFLTGGDQSVRGYALRDIGVPQNDGSVTAGRLLTGASLEWQRPVWSGGQRTHWESAVFVDAGAVANQVNDLRARVGLGAGVRYISPVGPLQMDLAYGLDVRRWRLHLSVGFVF